MSTLGYIGNYPKFGIIGKQTIQSGSTIIDLNYAPGTASALSVVIDGKVLEPDVDYTVANRTLTLATAASADGFLRYRGIEVGSDFQKQVGDLLVDATRTQKGLVRLATEEEVETGDNVSAAVTPDVLLPFVEGKIGEISHPSITGSAILNGTTDNTAQLTGIVTTLGLEVGDVIRIQYGGYDKLHTVESITNNNLIVVNYEHAGNRGNGSLKLANTTASVTVTRIAKWYNAPLGLGQAVVSLVPFRSGSVIYTNTTNRSIYVSAGIAGSEGTRNLKVDGIIASVFQGTSYTPNFPIVPGSTYELSGVATVWVEVR